MEPLLPRYFQLTVGAGEGETRLLSFDSALQSAGIANYNLIKVSSILPAFSTKKEKIDLPPGSLLPIAYAAFTSENPGERISAAIGVGIPKDKSKVGIIMEFSGMVSEEKAREKVFRMIIAAMNNRGIEIDDIEILSISHITEKIATVFGGCAIW